MTLNKVTSIINKKEQVISTPLRPQRQQRSIINLWSVISKNENNSSISIINSSGSQDGLMIASGIAHASSYDKTSSTLLITISDTASRAINKDYTEESNLHISNITTKDLQERGTQSYIKAVLEHVNSNKNPGNKLVIFIDQLQSDPFKIKICRMCSVQVFSAESNKTTQKEIKEAIRLIGKHIDFYITITV